MRAAGVIGPIASTSAGPTSGESLRATAPIRPLARSGGVFAVTRAMTSRAACGSVLRRSINCRAASMRAASGFDASEAAARKSLASPATNASSPLTPHREASPSIWPRASGESVGRSPAMARSASASSVGVLSRGHPFARPPMMASRTAGFMSPWRARTEAIESTGPPRA